MTETNERAQEPTGRPRLRSAASPTPTSTPTTDDQEQVRILTEEVRVPVTARDEFGNFDQALSVEDIIVLEDEVPQQVRSVGRVAANVVLLLDAGGEQNPAMRPQTTRDVALQLLSRLRPEDATSILQFNTRSVDVLHDWTTDKTASARVLRARLRMGTTARLTEALRLATSKLKERAMGNRHVVLITDGVERNRNSSAYAEAMKELNNAQATVHIISYTQLGRERLNQRESEPRGQSERDRIVEQGTIGITPQRGTAPVAPGGNEGNVARFGLSDFLRLRAYRRSLERSEAQLQTLADEMGGRIFLSRSTAEMTAHGGEIAREIGAQYTVTYTPRRPLSLVSAPEYRRLRIVPRRTNLQIQTRRGYVATPTR